MEALIMNQTFDLRDALKSWPFDPDHAARLTKGDDGRDILQVRTVMGLEQYELEGRPDGERPHGRASALEFYEERLLVAKAAGEGSAFVLTESECAELFTEGTLYYFRYLHLFQLQDWSRTLRDTGRNQRLFDFVHRYAEREEDRIYLEKWRPYILRMRAVSTAMIELDRKAPDRALAAVNDALAQIESLPDLAEETFKFERRRSVLALRELAGQIQKNRPVSEVEKLERQLRQAISAQEFERAAVLRDRLRALRPPERSN
jgi:hypothetical protein